MARAAHLYEGFAFGHLDLFLVSRLNADNLVHEAVHLLVDQEVNSPFATMPRWLNEGLAAYFESESDLREEVARAVRKDDILMLRNMDNVPGSPDEVRVFYAQAESTVQYMIETYGQDRMASLINAMKSGTPADDGLLEVYGLTIDELDAEWRSQYFPAVSLTRGPDPGTMVVSALVSLVVVVALMVAGLKRLRPKP
jgi:hypothetical protein